MKSPVANYDALIFITYKVRKYIPTSQIFYSLYIFVKFFGIILATHNTKTSRKTILCLLFFYILLVLVREASNLMQTLITQL